MEGQDIIKGRGAQFNPQNRFQQQGYEQQVFDTEDDWERFKNQKTQFFFDDSKKVVNKITSPDVGMDFSVNPYQGCEHGCIYCYARNTHEYWGYTAGHDFESKIIIKKNAPDLLRKAFDKKSWQPAVISLSGNTDCYQPIERKMKLTRQLLKVCLEYQNPVGVITKNALVLRDMDLLEELAKNGLARVYTSITGLDEDIRKILEPRTSTYKTRLNIIEQCSKKGIPTGVMAAPLIPGLNDHQLFSILKAASEAGAEGAGYTVARLNGAVGLIFRDWLEKTLPDRAEKIWHHIQSCHGGQVNDTRFGKRMRGDGNMAQIIKQQFDLYCAKFGLNKNKKEFNFTAFKRPAKNGQLSLFE